MFNEFDSALFLAFAKLFWNSEDPKGETFLNDLRRDLRYFESFIRQGLFKGLKSLQDVLQLLIRDHSVSVPAVIELYRIALTLPVASAGNERSFSTMKRVMDRLRTTMTDERLADLILIAIERQLGNDRADSEGEFYDFDALVDAFKNLPSQKNLDGRRRIPL